MSKRFASVNENVCVACGECINACPRKATAVINGCFAVVDKEKCVGCGICEKNCPAGCIVMSEE